MIQLPRLLDSSMKEIARLEPVSLALNLNMAPLSTATMTLPQGQTEVQTGAFVELFTPHGSAGIFRVQQAHQEFGGVMTLNLEHGLVTLSDGIIPGTLEEEKTTSAREALAEIIGYQDRWKLGAVEVPENTMLSWSYDYSNLLESLLSILDKLPAYMATFDQTTTPWAINIVTVSETPASECRLSRNISTLAVETDRSELCTRLYIPGLEAPLEADTIGKWGAVSRSLTGDEGLTADELTAYGNRYLDEHKDPSLTVSIDAFDLSEATGEPMDVFRLGYVCRVCLPDYGQTINQRIVSLSWPDMVADDGNVTLTLASSAETAADTLAGLIVDTTVQRRLIYKNGQELDRLVVRVITNEDQISIITPRLEILSLDIEVLADKISLQANDIITLSAGVDENKSNITLANGRIDANAAAIALKADQASLELANGRIDAQANEIALKADKIELEGLVKATDLEVVRADITNLTSGVTTASTLKASVLNADTTLIVGGEVIGKRQITMGEVVTVGRALSTDAMDLQHSHKVTVNDDGTVTLGEVSAEGGNFKIADTKTYQEGVSAAYGNGYNVGFADGKDAYLPTVITRTGYSTTDKTVTVRAANSHQDLLTGQVIDASEIYSAGDSAGYNRGYSAGNGAGYNTGYAAGKDAYTPTVITRTAYSVADKNVTVKASNSHQDLLTGKTIDASEIYTAGYNAGFAAAESQYTAGTYYKGNGSTVYARGTSVTPTQRTLYVAPTGGATAVTVYDVGSSSTLYKGNGGSYVSRGEAVTAYIKE